MDIRQLQYFVRIADEGSITGAARSLHMSQPPLSMQMKLLEEELGVTLFDRGSRTIRLTDAGKLLYNRAQGILELSGATVRELKDFGNGLAGTLRLGLISSAGTGEIGRRMRRFSKKYPEVRYEISEGNTYELLEMLRQGRIEVALPRRAVYLRHAGRVGRLQRQAEPLRRRHDLGAEKHPEGHGRDSRQGPRQGRVLSL